MRSYIGCDVVKVSRIKKMMLSQSVLKKVFHPSELLRFEAEHLAGVFAAKEATFKALGLESDSWLLLEVQHRPSGKPELIMASQINDSKILSLDCSIAHDGGLAFAVVTVLKEE
ncbi:MAG TPA: 4'-phosphopantetheinyl transferase superfamily protein [Candidatus Saccharimonadales bacterium]|jgi:phosphopantetheine--protein transferase-like protein|nr:4'-phosphopantetheinyl transferase superfamily protein [Candidatus Saccharimonadales bacterium]